MEQETINLNNKVLTLEAKLQAMELYVQRCKTALKICRK